MSKMNDKEIVKELREITKNKKSWKANIDDVASKLDNTYSDTKIMYHQDYFLYLKLLPFLSPLP